MNLILVLILIFASITIFYLYYFIRLLQQVIINLWKYPESQHLDRFNLPDKKDYRKLTVDAMPIIEPASEETSYSFYFYLYFT